MHFKSPEHAIRVAYFILATRIEPSTSLQKIIKEYEEMTGERIQHSTDMTPHDWRVQVVWIINLTKRLVGHKIGFHVLQGIHGDIMNAEVRQSLFEVSHWLNPTSDSRERLITDLITTHILRGRPTQQFIADQFGVAQKTISRIAIRYRDMINIERDHVNEVLWSEFKAASLLSEELTG